MAPGAAVRPSLLTELREAGTVKGRIGDEAVPLSAVPPVSRRGVAVAAARWIAARPPGGASRASAARGRAEGDLAGAGALIRSAGRRAALLVRPGGSSRGAPDGAPSAATFGAATAR
ncbi:hypothetical protein GCM10022245_00770 [Streptomyces mayteni]